MMNDPYSVLGVSPSATDDEIKKAYRKLAKQYHPDIHPDPAFAEKKMAEINAAYDQVLNQRQGKTAGGAGYGGYNYGGYNYGGGQQGSTPEYTAVRHYLHYRRYREAFNVLNRITDRNAEWYFLSAYAHAGVGNRAQALEFARKAAAMDPQNVEYQQLLQQLQYAGTAYESYGRGFSMPTGGVNPICMGLCLAKLCCPYC